MALLMNFVAVEIGPSSNINFGSAANNAPEIKSSQTGNLDFLGIYFQPDSGYFNNKK